VVHMRALAHHFLIQCKVRLTSRAQRPEAAAMRPARGGGGDDGVAPAAQCRPRPDADAPGAPRSVAAVAALMRGFVCSVCETLVGVTRYCLVGCARKRERDSGV
jgi:hypothetical protein